MHVVLSSPEQAPSTAAEALPALTVWAFLYGTHALVLRAALGASRFSLLWGLATLPLALVPALMLAWRRLPWFRRIGRH